VSAITVKASYNVRLLSEAKALQSTIAIYREALSFIIDVVNREWDAIDAARKEHLRQGFAVAEQMIHKTGKNPEPKYNFDEKFYKFPSYFRRAAINYAIGAVSSYKSNLKNYIENGRQGNCPALTVDRAAMPTFYRGGMSSTQEMLRNGKCFVELKLYVRNDWVWVKLPCRKQDVKYLNRHWSNAEGVEISAPTLEVVKKPKHRNVYSIRFLFTQKRDLALNDTPLDKRTILSVDLGINADATCSVMDAAGTVIARKSINFAGEKDRLDHILNRIKKLQRKHGRTGGRHEWSKAMRVSDNLAAKIAQEIADTACYYAVNVIVFEYLDMKGKIKGRKKQKLHLWRKNGISKTGSSIIAT